MVDTARAHEIWTPGEPYLVSPSQVDQFDRCERKWGFKKIEGLPDPSTPEAQVGTLSHDATEGLVLRGSAEATLAKIDMGVSTAATRERVLRLANALYQHHKPLLDRAATVQTEAYVKIPRRVDGWDFFLHGYIDLFVTDTDDVVHVIDYKTSNSPRYWKTPAMLERDAQALVYAAHAFWTFPKLETVQLEWTYVKSKGAPKIDPRKAQFEKRATWDRLAEIVVPVAGRITAARNTCKSALELSPDPTREECGRFRGCPYVDLCPRPKTKLRDIMPATKLIRKAPPRPEELKASAAREPALKVAPEQEPEAKAKPKIKIRPRLTPPKTEEAEAPKAKRPGLDPEKTRMMYKRKAEEEAPQRDFSEAEHQWNAPEVDHGEDEPLVEASKAALTDRNLVDSEKLAEAAEQIAGKEDGEAPTALTAEDIFDRLVPGEQLTLSTKKANTSHEYVTKRVLGQIEASGRAKVAIVGQLAYLDMPKAPTEVQNAWVAFASAALHGFAQDTKAAVDTADELTKIFRKRFEV